jgi:class 3 adenylate cyclase
MESLPEGPITCLFTDIESSTNLSDMVHPDTGHRVANEHDRILTVHTGAGYSPTWSWRGLTW